MKTRWHPTFRLLKTQRYRILRFMGTVCPRILRSLETIWNGIPRFLIGTFLTFFQAFPILWILIVSFQPGNVAYVGKYRLIPDVISSRAFELALTDSADGFFKSLKYSFEISTIATLIGLFFAFSAIYLIKTDSIISRDKNRIIRWSISLYFLPGYLVFQGLVTLAQLFNILGDTEFRLLLVHTMLAYVISTIFLLVIYASAQKSHFEQLLLETKSRMKAFYFGIVAPQAIGTFVVAGLTFATIWSEFFLTFLIAANQQPQPFSIVLQKAQGQYAIEYSSFAAGAAISMFAWSMLLLVLIAAGASIHKIVTYKRWSRY